MKRTVKKPAELLVDVAPFTMTPVFFAPLEALWKTWVVLLAALVLPPIAIFPFFLFQLRLHFQRVICSKKRPPAS